MSKTILICVGSSKCGTTWLHSELKQHHQCHFPPGKEIHYWEWIRSPHLPESTISDRLAQLEVPGIRVVLQVASVFSGNVKAKFQRFERYKSMLEARHSEDHTAYLDYIFENSGNSVVVGDITPNYVLLNRRTFGEMLSVYSDVKFLLMMRDPVERLWSSVKFESRKVKASKENISEFLHKRFLDATLNQFDFLHRKSRYEQTIRELEASVPPERICYMFYENIFFRNDYKKLFDFLGIEVIHMDTGSTINSGRTSISRPGQEQWQLAIDRFSDTYNFVESKFGENVPEEWNSSQII